MLAYVLLTRGEQVERWRLAAFGTGAALALAGAGAARVDAVTFARARPPATMLA